jgi:protein-L-isoaspartate(D-aspartate) O-methyltransferase
MAVMRRTSRILAAAWIASLGLALGGCNHGPPTDQSAPPPSPVAAPERGDSPAARGMRELLAQSIEQSGSPWETSGPWDGRVIAAIRKVPRHLFMPAAPIEHAYLDSPYPIGHGQTISQPTIVAMMTDALDLSGKEKVLEIGTGSGYQAAVLSLLARQVYSIEIVEPLGEAANRRLQRLGYHNVEVRIGDGYKGWPEEAPFDRIILTAAPPAIPDALVAQLADGGVLVAPVGDAGDQRLVRWRKSGGKITREELAAVRFVPMVPGGEGR